MEVEPEYLGALTDLDYSSLLYFVKKISNTTLQQAMHVHRNNNNTATVFVRSLAWAGYARLQCSKVVLRASSAIVVHVLQDACSESEPLE